MSTKYLEEDSIRGEGLGLVAIAAILSWTLLAFLTRIGFVSYDISRWIMYSTLLLVSISIFLYLYGTSAGFVKDIDPDYQLAYVVAFIFTIILSATVLVISITFV